PAVSVRGGRSTAPFLTEEFQEVEEGEEEFVRFETSVSSWGSAVEGLVSRMARRRHCAPLRSSACSQANPSATNEVARRPHLPGDRMRISARYQDEGGFVDYDSASVSGLELDSTVHLP